MLRKIAQAKASYPPHMSRKLQALLVWMLQPRPDRRPNFEQIVNDPWLKELPQAEWASLKEEVMGYGARKNSVDFFEQKQLKFNVFGFNFLRKLLFRNLELRDPIDIENYTTAGTPEEELARLELVLHEELTMDVDRWRDGCASYVRLTVVRQVPGK